MNIVDALKAIPNRDIARRLNQTHKILEVAQRADTDAFHKAEATLKPAIQAVKRYVSQRLRKERLGAHFEGRGWHANYRDRTPIFAMSVNVHVAGMKLTFSIAGKTLGELDSHIDAAIDAAKALRDRLPTERLKVVSA